MMPRARIALVRWPWVLGGFCLAVLLLLRLVPTVFVPSLNWGDEIYQTSEPAHRLVFGNGLMTWEFVAGIRSWLLPGAIAAIMAAGRMLGGGPGFYLPAIATVCAAVSLVPVLCTFFWCRRRFGPWAAFAAAAIPGLAPELIYFGARPMAEAVAAHALAAGLFLAARRRDDSAMKVFAGALLGLALALRPQILPACAVLAVWPGISGRWRMAAGALAMLVAASLLDWVTLGAPSASLWRYAMMNMSGASTHFGTEPWYYYLVMEAAIWGPALPIPIVLCGLGARKCPLPLMCAVAVIGAHMLIAHKEYRFIYPAQVLLACEAGIGMAIAVTWAAGRISALRSRFGDIAGASVIGAGVWAACCAAIWFSPNFAMLRARAHTSLQAADYAATVPGVCGIGMGPGRDAWVPYGGYTHLHRDVPLFWPADQAAFGREQYGFNLLLSARTEPGFDVLKCFGMECVARRQGDCQTLPADRMPGAPAGKTTP